jgi:hypothetical protein
VPFHFKICPGASQKRAEIGFRRHRPWPHLRSPIDHRFPSGPNLVYIHGIIRYLRTLAPDVIRTFKRSRPLSVSATIVSALMGIPLFAECHVHASVLRDDSEAVAGGSQAQGATNPSLEAIGANGAGAVKVSAEGAAKK